MVTVFNWDGELIFDRGKNQLLSQCNAKLTFAFFFAINKVASA